MAKTYNTFTDVSAGSVLTATGYNEVLENIANYRVPPALQLVRTLAINPYTSGTSIAWSSATYDTESPSSPMWSSGATVTIQTTGIYLITLSLDIRTSSAMTGNCYAYLKLNGTGFSYSLFPTTSNPRIVANYVISLTASNTIEAVLEFGGGGTAQVNGAASGADQSRMNVTWLGQVS